jgi:hypothetical protein
METNTKRRRGRPKNSTTLQTIQLSELIEKFGPETEVPVGRLWLQGKTQASTFTPVAAQFQTGQIAAPKNKIEMPLIID